MKLQFDICKVNCYNDETEQKQIWIAYLQFIETNVPIILYEHNRHKGKATR